MLHNLYLGHFAINSICKCTTTKDNADTQTIKMPSFLCMPICVYWSMWDSSLLLEWKCEIDFLSEGQHHFGQESLWCNEIESARASFKPVLLVGTEHWFDLNFWKWYQFSYESHFPYLFCISFSFSHNIYFFHFFLPLFLSHIFNPE